MTEETFIILFTVIISGVGVYLNYFRTPKKPALIFNYINIIGFHIDTNTIKSQDKIPNANKAKQLINVLISDAPGLLIRSTLIRQTIIFSAYGKVEGNNRSISIMEFLLGPSQLAEYINYKYRLKVDMKHDKHFDFSVHCKSQKDVKEITSLFKDGYVQRGKSFYNVKFSNAFLQTLYEYYISQS